MAAWISPGDAMAGWILQWKTRSRSRTAASFSGSAMICVRTLSCLKAGTISFFARKAALTPLSSDLSTTLTCGRIFGIPTDAPARGDPHASCITSQRRESSTTPDAGEGERHEHTLAKTFSLDLGYGGRRRDGAGDGAARASAGGRARADPEEAAVSAERRVRQLRADHHPGREHHLLRPLRRQRGQAGPRHDHRH